MPLGYQKHETEDTHCDISAWFLGPRAENVELFKRVVTRIIDIHAAFRKDCYPEDPKEFITPEIKNSPKFKASIKRVEEEAYKLSLLLNQRSLPTFSPRYFGHMYMEMSLPSIVGWIATLLLNPNNLAYELGPFTTLLELEVGKQLCRMLGYDVPGHESCQLSNVLEDKDCPELTSDPWGHITTDGTIANAESMWAARNLKFYPLSLHGAMSYDGPLSFIADDFMIRTSDRPDEETRFISLNTWELLNLPVTEVLGIADRLLGKYHISPTFLSHALKPYLVQTTGTEKLLKKWKVSEPQYLVASTGHYSWPKSAALLGIGSNNCVKVPVDNAARMDMNALSAMLEQKLQARQPVYAVVAIIGTTEEGSVDPLDDILALRDDFSRRGLSFVVHADAAWGGYFASMIRPAPTNCHDGNRPYVSNADMRPSVVKHFEALARADSITIDPHKAGYIPYPAGGLCYRDGRMRFLLTWSASYLQQSKEGKNIATYSIEGSKPGAAAAACYLHHRTIGLHRGAHGALLSETSWTSRCFSAYWATLEGEDYYVVPFNTLNRETGNFDFNSLPVEEEKCLIREKIIGKTNEEIVQDDAALVELNSLGSDLNINAFACNFRIDGEANDDVEEANFLNKRIFDRFSVTSIDKIPGAVRLFLSSTVFSQNDYEECLRHFQRRLKLETESCQDLFVLRSVVMSPFPTSCNYLAVLMNEFENVLREEALCAIHRNRMHKQIHKFTMQGTDKLYLVYRPRFYNKSGQWQFIMRVDIGNCGSHSDTAAWETYVDTRKRHPRELYTLETEHEMKFTDISEQHQNKEFNAIVRGRGIDPKGLKVIVRNMEIIKKRSLCSKYRDKDYPMSYTPFHLYGTNSEQHLDHILSRAPNVQISTDCVDIRVAPSLTEKQLKKGVILRIHLPERSMQPFGTKNAVFTPKATFLATVVDDTIEVTAERPGSAVGDKTLAKGTVTFGQAVYWDADDLNFQEP